MIKELIKALNEPKTINKSFMGCYVAIWDMTKQQAINKFKKAGFNVNKSYSPYYIVLFESDGIINRIDVANRKGEIFQQSISESDIKGFEHLLDRVRTAEDLLKS